MSQVLGSAVSAHDFAFAGASPNHSATSAFTFGETIQSIQRYMQFGCLALDEIIHVSDQPVAPSFGRMALTGTLSASSRLVITCQVVPITLFPPAKAACSLV